MVKITIGEWIADLGGMVFISDGKIQQSGF